MSIEKLLHQIHNHIIILGYNSRVERIVEELSGNGANRESASILIVSEMEKIPPCSEKVHVHFYKANPSSEKTLKHLRIEKASVLLVVAQESEENLFIQSSSVDAHTVLTIINLQRYFSHYLASQKPPRVIAECMEESTMEHLKNAGCDEIIMIGNTSASLLATTVINPGITPFLGEVFSTLYGNQFYIVDPPPEVADLSFLQALKKIKVQYGDILVAVKRGHCITVNPRRFILQKGDKVVVLSSKTPNYEAQHQLREEHHV